MKKSDRAADPSRQTETGVDHKDDGPAEPAGAPRGMERSFAILDYIAQKPARVVDVTRDLNLPWATVHRTITQLERAQFLRRDDRTSRYEIGPRLWHIGSAYLANNATLKSALAYLSQARNIKNVAVQVVERMGNHSVVIHAEQRQTDEITKASYGYHFPLHCGSKGWVLLAYESDAFIDAYLARDLERMTAHTITDPDRIRKELEAVRHNGYAITESDVQLFTGSISAPIFDDEGRIAASICFVYLKKVAADEERIDALIQELLQMANSVSFDLGWNPSRS